MNTHPTTGIAYGYIGSHVMDSELVDILLYGSQAKNLTYERAKAEYVAAQRLGHDENATGEFDEVRSEEKFAEDYQGEEETIAGEHEGVRYQSSWMGGALHFFIFESPHVKGHAPCSLCVPGAGDLHNDGLLPTYDVPDEWRA